MPLLILDRPLKPLLSFALLFVLTTLCFAADAVGFEKEIQPLLKKYCVRCHGPEKQKADLRLDTLNRDLVNGPDAGMWQEALDLINVSEMPPKEATQPSAAERQILVEALTLELRRAMEAKRSSGGRNVMRRLTAYEYNNTLRDLLGLNLDFAGDLPPEGTAHEGFKNNSTVLGTSALHLEYFERIARSALERIILAPEEKPTEYFVRIEPERAYEDYEKQLAAYEQHLAEAKAQKAAGGNQKKRRRVRKPVTGYSFTGRDFQKPGNTSRGKFQLDHGEPDPDGKAIILAGNRPQDRIGDPFAADRKIGGARGDGRSGYQPEFRVEMYEVPYDAPVLVRIHASAIPGKGGTFPRLSFELGSFRGAGTSDQKEGANIEITSTEAKTYEFVVHGANFPFRSNKPNRPSYFRIFNDFRRGTSQLTYEELPKLRIDWVEITGNHFATWPTPQKRALLIESPNRDNEAVYVREILGKFMKRAYRRPVADSEVDRKVALFQRLRQQEPNFNSTLISTLAAVLCSSHFLMHSEPAPKAVQADAVVAQRKLNGHELASRLSYFLWSSMPDEELFTLAEKRQLNRPRVLLAQVRRMLAHPKASGFSQNFAAQWLDLAGVRRLAVNPEYFSGFEEKTKNLFEQESIQFLHHVLSENLSITNFIDSQFAMLSPDLARHYRVPDISGGTIRAHAVDRTQHRGGLLTQASMLFGNSTGAETHPIKRGVWVLERMLDDPPPPPPPNVPELPEPEAQDESKLSLKERLVAHAEVESCRDCHAKIDPWGVAFENYNALGQWREGDRDLHVLKEHQSVNIDPSTQLKNGRRIRHLDDLKQYILADRKSQFRRALVRKVMGYALGRYLEFSDRASVDAICKTLEQKRDRLQTLIEQVVLSEPFQTK